MNQELVRVKFKKHGVEYVAYIFPLSKINRPFSICDGKLPIVNNATPIWLPTKSRAEVEAELFRQNLNPYDYIQEATVHPSWKLQRHQGVIYAKKVKVI